MTGMNAHLATVHTQEVLADTMPAAPQLKPAPAVTVPSSIASNSCIEDDLPLGATFETTIKKAASAQQLPTVITQLPSPLPSQKVTPNKQAAAATNGAPNSQSAAPIPGKPVELDNAGRVKSGKVRKQCELCGQWSNIKWFFKHMSEVHQVSETLRSLDQICVKKRSSIIFCRQTHFGTEYAKENRNFLKR